MTDPITIDGIPAGQFVSAEREAQRRGKTFISVDDGTAFDRKDADKGEIDDTVDRETPRTANEQFPTEEPSFFNQSSQGEVNNLFAQAKEKLLFEPPAAEQGKPAESAGANVAFSESIAFRDPDNYDRRKAAYLADSTVMSELYTSTILNQKEQGILDSGLLASDYWNGLDKAGKMQALQIESDRLDQRQVTPRIHMLMQIFSSGGEDVPIEAFNEMHRSTPFQDISDSMIKYVAHARREREWDLNEIVAMNGFDGTLDALTQVGYTDMTLGLPLFIRQHTLNVIAESMGAEGRGVFAGLALGSYRQDLRDWLISLNHEDFGKALKGLNETFMKIKEDPEGDILITRYALLEQLEAIFTEDVFDGQSAVDKGDVWMGNLEGVLEGLFTVLIAKGVVKGTSRLFRSGSTSVEAANAARSVGAHRVASNIDELVQREELGVQFGLGGDEAVATMLPNPRVIDTTELPDGTKKMVEFNERVSTELLESTDAITGQALSKADRTAAINKDIEALDMADGAVVHGRMNKLDMFENGTGYRMRVVAGDSAEGGYKNIEDAMEEALDIDPLLGKVNIERVAPDGTLEPVFDSPNAFARAVAAGDVDSATAARILGGDSADESFYLTYDVERFWHSSDKDVLGSTTFLSSGMFPRVLLSPNAKFGDEIYGSFLKAYMGEHSIKKNFELIFKPYYKLNKEDKAFVASVYEWMETYGKEHQIAPDLSMIRARYDGITETQLNGIVAMQQGMDTLHALFNRRLYRDWQALGYKTAMPVDATHATYHGLELERSAASGGMVLDPVTGKMLKLSNRDLDDLYNGGARVMEVDMAVDAVNDAGHKATRILIREDTYKIGKLDTQPMDYTPAYNMRFYDDPYYIVKETEGLSLNGTLRSGAAGRTVEAIKTAGTKAEGERFKRRANRAEQERGTASTFKVVRASDITQSESTLFQKQTIQREGRLFWDKRNADRLPDVNGNRATLEDPVKALERGLGIASRQLTHEDTLKSIKGAWENSYKKFFAENDELLERFDLGELSARMSKMISEEVNSVVKAEMKGARELLDYMRLIEGTESKIIPLLREAALSVATTVNRVTGLKSSRLEKAAMSLDPLRTMRSTAFKAFLVLRPVRQLILQSSQIGYLAPLAPKYVASVQFFKDAIAMQRGLTALRVSGYADGWSVKNMAKSMNLTEKEYRLLVKEFDRSGLLDLVDVHSFAGGTAQAMKVANDGMMGTVGYRTRQFSKATLGWFQKVGFNKGESNNLTFTYNLALKRTMEKKGYKSVLDMTRGDWDKLRVDASNLALGMVRPNNFGYQSGILSVGTQFLSFQHKAALGLLGQNPAIKGGDQLRLLFGTYLLYGANMYGGRDLANQWLTDLGVPDQQIGETGISLVDVISAGIVENTINAVGNLTIDEFKNIDAGFATPGVDLDRLIEMQFDSIMNQPIKAAFGAFGNIASKTLEGFNVGSMIQKANPDLPASEKFMFFGDAVLKGALPLYNDVVLSYTGYKMNQWYSSSGNPLPLTPTLDSALARGVFGVRTREEMQYYNFQSEIWDQQENYNNIVKETSQYFSRLVGFYSDGTMTREDLTRQIEGIMNLWEDWPEGKRMALSRDIMSFQQNDGLLTKTLQKHIVEAMAKKEVDVTRLIPMINNMTNIPEATRAQLIQIILDAHDSKQYVDEVALDALKDSLQ